MGKTKIKCITDKNTHFYSGIIPDASVPSSTGVDCVKVPQLIPWAVKKALQKAIKDMIYILVTDPEFFLPNPEIYPYDPLRMVKENIKSVISNAKSAPKEIFDESGKVGSTSHQHINRFLLGHEDAEISDESIRDKVKARLNGIKKFCYEHKVLIPDDIIYTEKPIGSRIFRYGGTCDCKMKLDGKITIVDFKTGSGPWDKDYRQISSYWAADQELGSEGGITEQLAILNLDDSGDYKLTIISLEEARDHFESFRCLVDFWWKELERKKNIKMKRRKKNGH